MKTTHSICLLLCLAMTFLAVGCGSGDKVTEQMKAANQENIRRVRNCYAMFMDLNQYNGPKDKAELMNFLKTDRGALKRLERIGVSQEQVDSMWVSERDGEEFVIRWGVSGLADHAVVFEATGVEGKRLVCFATPRELDDSDYDGYLSGKLKGEGPEAERDIMGDDAMEEMKAAAQQ